MFRRLSNGFGYRPSWRGKNLRSLTATNKKRLSENVKKALLLVYYHNFYLYRRYASVPLVRPRASLASSRLTPPPFMRQHLVAGATHRPRDGFC